MTGQTQANLSVLARRNPQLADRLRKIIDSGGFPEPFSGRNGSPTCRIESPGGKIVTLHSTIDPVREAVTQLKALQNEPVDAPVLVFGFGLGYLAEALVESVEAPVFSLIFREDILAATCASRDLTRLFSDDRHMILAGNQSNLIRDVHELTQNEVRLLFFDPELELAPAGPLIDAAVVIRRSRAGQKASSNAIRSNIAANLEKLLSDPPVSDLKNAGLGCAGVLIAAGPGLDHSLESLKHNAQGCITVAVDASLAALQKHGVLPDFVVSVDPNITNLRQMSLPPPHPPLVYFPSIPPGVLENWSAPAIAALPAQDPLAQAIENAWPVGILESGGSVATAAFSLLKVLGCEPIILVGLDLAFPGGVSHAEGSLWRKQMIENRYTTWVESVDGGKAATSRFFDMTRRWFELRIAGEPQTRVINSSTSGALIRGCINMTIDEALKVHYRQRTAAIPLPQRRKNPPGLMQIRSALQEKFSELFKGIKA